MPTSCTILYNLPHFTPEFDIRVQDDFPDQITRIQSLHFARIECNKTVMLNSACNLHSLSTQHHYFLYYIIMFASCKNLRTTVVCWLKNVQIEKFQKMLSG